jgi:hypothetical protein
VGVENRRRWTRPFVLVQAAAAESSLAAAGAVAAKGAVGIFLKKNDLFFKKREG